MQSNHAEFFRLLTGLGNPVFRRCTRKWVHGAQIGVTFDGTNIGIKSAKEALRRMVRRLTGRAECFNPVAVVMRAEALIAQGRPRRRGRIQPHW